MAERTAETEVQDRPHLLDTRAIRRATEIHTKNKQLVVRAEQKAEDLAAVDTIVPILSTVQAQKQPLFMEQAEEERGIIRTVVVMEAIVPLATRA